MVHHHLHGLVVKKHRNSIKEKFSNFYSYLGPLYDHTLGTDDGSYAFIDTNKNRKINDTAVLVSQSMPATGSGGMCLEFFYHM